MATNNITWRIYYSDRLTHDSSMGEPILAPAYGVICIVQLDPVVNRMIMHGWDWYYYEPTSGQWWGSDMDGVKDRLLHRLPVIALCQGRNVSNDDFRIIMGLADQDPDFPVKAGNHRYESPSQARQALAIRDHHGA